MTIKTIAMLVPCLLLAACADEGDDPGVIADEMASDTMATADALSPSDPAMDGSGATATAAVQDADGNELGTLTLTETEQMIQLSGMLHGLPPGTHAIHIHQVGQCEAPFTTAGGHWNPTEHEHGIENPQGPHLGDMPNIEVPADGMATIEVSTPVGATLQGSNGLLDADGAAVIVHAGADDYRTNPSGDAGDRIACGVVTTD